MGAVMAVVMRIARRLILLEYRVRSLEEKEKSLMANQDQLAQDVADLTGAESDMESRVNAEIANLEEQIAALKAAGVDPAQLAELEASTARLRAFAAAAPPVSPDAPATA